MVVGLLGVVVPFAQAQACDCLAKEATIAEALERSDAVFEGVTSKAPTTAGKRRRYEVKVLRAWKGVAAGSVLTFETNDSDCGIHLNVGSSVILAAVRQKDGAFVAQRCNARMTAVYDHQLSAARKALDAATKPDAGN